ncbi:MAG: pyridoxine kinase [Bacteroidales bacterium]|jgi:pyridoxine kinase|nr:pyridoxine kinase [Bacteroidales bacterium]MDN5330660.1 pyridoxine kinase [Bacteroidales bacterium]
MKRPIKRVAAIHDISGYGKASLTVVIPILSTMGIQVCPLPTAVLSTHSKFKGFYMHDLTDELEPMMAHWKSLDLHFDAIYTGFLGSARQIEIVERFIRDFKNTETLVIIDPVMGDDGTLYSTMNEEMVRGMRRLIAYADIITPNLTELSFIIGENYHTDIPESVLRSWIQRAIDMGPETVILTSVPQQGLPRRTAVLAYGKNTGKCWKVSCDYIPANYPGTGDAFASIITGSLLQGDSLPIALDRAVQFISYAIRATFGYQHDPTEGLLLERVLNNLHAPVQVSSYELLD